MIKIAAFIDPHYMRGTPRSRKDNYKMAILNKLVEIIEIGEEEKVDAFISSGDLFHKKGKFVEFSEVIDLMSIFLSTDIPIYGIAGNHDLIGHNIKTLNDNGIGVLIASKIINLLDKKPFHIKKENEEIYITGKSYSEDYDTNKKSYNSEISEKSALIVHVVHGMLVENSFFGKYSTIDEISKSTNADIIICGHYHPGFGYIKKNGKHFINPGAISRGTFIQNNFDRTPSIAIIEIDKKNVNVEIRKLKSSLPGKDIFKYEEKKIEEEYNKEIQEFGEMLNNEIRDIESEDIMLALDEVAKIVNMGVDIINKAKLYIEKAEQQGG